ncbi:MAG: VWA domain-containing protein [Ketobacter sp.]
MIILKWMPLLLILPLPWILRALLPRAAQSDSGLLRVPFFNNVNEVVNHKERNQNNNRRSYRFLLVFIWFLLVVSAAGPQYIGDPIHITSKARDLMLAVDVSESMRVTDMQLKGDPVDRLVVVKSVLADFIRQRTSDRLGLILFGSRAYLQTPLTFDRKTLLQLLNESSIGIAGKSTAIGDAIGLALKRLQDRPNDSKVLILLTDGQNRAGEIDPITAANLAAQKGLKIYTVGVGADEYIAPGIFGTRFGARRLNPAADLDEDALKQVASITGGRYFRAKSAESLKNIYALLDELEPVDATPETFRPVKALFHYPLALALLLTIAISLFTITRNYGAHLKVRRSGQENLARSTGAKP